MADNSPIQRLRDRVAKGLWSGDVVDDPTHTDSGVAGTSSSSVHHRNQQQWSRTEVGVSKQDTGLRRGTVPEHIESPIKGRPRSYNPLSLRQLGKSGEVQIQMAAILGDLESVPWSVVPVDEETDVPNSVLDDAERALEDPNPNPESFEDINSMLARDLLEVGNCVSVVNLQVDDRRAEAVPLDPNTFTADWNSHRILQRFYQYPRAEQRWGQPEEIDREIVMWGVFQPTQTRAGIYGYSPVEMVARFINIMGGLVDKEINELEEGMPSGLITLIGDEWSDRDYDKFETYWENEVKGEQIKHPYTRGEADFVPFNMTYKELQVLDRQQWYSKLVAAAFRTPVSETGLAIGEEMTRATDVSMRQKYKQRALGAILRNLETLWTSQYLQRWWHEDIKLQFDPGRDLMEKREIAETNKLRLENGTTTVNEIRQERGEDPVPWGDEPGTPRTRGSGSSGNSGVLTPEDENQNAVGPDGEGLPALANKNAASVSFDGTKGGKLDKPKIDKDEHTLSDHYLFGSGDTKGDYSYPVVDANDNLRKGNVKSAYKVGASGEGVSESDLHRKLKKLNSEFDSPPLDIEDGDIAGAKRAGNFSTGGYDVADGYWLPEDAEVVSKKALRSTDDYRQFSFQPGEVDALKEGIEGVYADAIESVLNRIKGNQQLLRQPTEDQPAKTPRQVRAQKNIPALMKLIEEEIGIGFAEDVRDVVVEHKTEKITAGEEDILTELRQAGLTVDDVDLEQTRDRVVERIRSRTLEITKPISKRLESDLRSVIETAWTEGHRITDVEGNIEELTEQWQGHEAERLARDQLGKAAKEGRTEYAEATGDQVGGWARTWIATGGRTGDGRTRDSHKRMHGETVGPGESWDVDYRPDGGPASVSEKFPGASVWGIQCRCDFSLSPAGLAKSVGEWADDPTRRMEEVEAEQGRPIDKLMLEAELGDESRTAAAKRLGVSKQTFYTWLRDSGLYDR